MKRLALIAFLLSAPAMAQDVPVETVTAYGKSLVGIWRVGQPDFISVNGMFSAPTFGPPRQTYCRIAPRNDDLSVFCNDAGRDATMTVEDRHVHIAWGTMMLRFVMDGEVESTERFHGHFQIKASGLTFENSRVSEAVRVMPQTADGSGKAELVRRILEQGLASVPHDDKSWKKGLPEQPRLGAISAIAYVGRESVALAADAQGYPPFEVYLVNFAQGERLCFLHQQSDVVNGFRCV